ncbi:methyltransf_25 domain-containing protein [Trichonephila clavipes]|nr:methyltransf_25 domain-containing protein [Trichonephila clavipes]
MPLNYDAEIFSQLDKPWDSIARFLILTLPELGWGSSHQEEVVMDVGCGPGRITSEFILPIFPKLKKIVAIDAVSSMIKLARSMNPHPKIEYAVTNFEDRSVMDLWKRQITKLVCIQCFNRMADQKEAFRKIYELLPPQGEAAFVFLLHNGYYDALPILAKDPKWSSFLPEWSHSGHFFHLYDVRCQL